MNKLLTAVIQIALLAAGLACTSASADDGHDASMETANQMCVFIDDKLICAPTAEAVIRVASSDQS